jgi:hypothetical protein
MTPLLGIVAALASAAGLSPLAAPTASDQASMAMARLPMPMSASRTELDAMPQASARFFRNVNGDISVRLIVTGVTPASEHNVDVEQGGCPATFRLGADLAPAAVVQANDEGQIDQTVDLGRRISTLPRAPIAVTLRQGLTANVMDGGSNPLGVQGLACAQLPNHIGYRSRNRQMNPASESGMPLSGWVTYTYNPSDPRSSTGKSVTVRLSAVGFIPGSVHAAHIHSGTCTSQGAVVVMLGDLTADPSGDVSATDTLPVTQRPQGPLYVNVHEGDSNNILSAGMPTLAFRPLLCANLSSTWPTRIPVPTVPPVAPPHATAPMPPQPMPPQPMPVVSGRHW